MTRHIGADRIIPQACMHCGHWPYVHEPDCSVEKLRDQERAELAAALAAAAGGK